MKLNIRLPVQFRDIDRMGHVNHAVYLQYMETARVQLARQLGMIRNVSTSSFIVAMAHVEYRRPIRNEPFVTVSCWVTRIGERSWDLDYTVHGPRNLEFAIGRTTQVCYNYTSRSPMSIRKGLKTRLAAYFGKPLEFRENSLNNSSSGLSTNSTRLCSFDPYVSSGK